jgi:hypothetical protein
MQRTSYPRMQQNDTFEKGREPLWFCVTGV